MIVDVHTHIPTHVEPVPENEEVYNDIMRPDTTVRLSHSFSDFHNAMVDVDMAIAFGIAANPHGGERVEGAMKEHTSINDIASNLANTYPDKVIGFMSVHPDDPHVIDEMDRCVNKLDLKGMKLAPNYQNFEPMSSSALEVYSYAEQNKLPILFHQGTGIMRTAPLRYTHPLVMDEIAMLFPDLKIIMAHMGHPWNEDCITVIRKHPNVYADVSGLFYRPWQMYNGMRLAYEWSVFHKLLFGSDWPLTTPTDTINHLRGMVTFAKKHNLPGFPNTAFEEIINRETLSLLGLT